MSDTLGFKSGVLPLTILGVLQSFQRTEALKTAIELDLFTAIGERGSSAAEIADQCSASARGIRALCDYLCLTGLLQKQSERYRVSEEAALFLDSRSPQFIGTDAVRSFASGAIAQGYENLADAVRKGGTALPSSGTLAPEHPSWPQHARALAPIGAANAKLLANVLNSSCSGPLRVLDIASGHGHFGIAIAKENPV